MALFASKTPRDLNHDPMPYWTPGGNSADRRWAAQSDLGLRQYRPRPEFDHVQHNAPNPILLAFRDHVAWRWVYLPVVATYAEDAETFLAGLDADPILDTTPAHHDHARRVLERLAAL